MRRFHAILLSLMLLAATVPSTRGEDEASLPPRAPDCVYVGTPNDVVAKMIEMAQIRPDDYVCDPGCGDGRMVIAAARSHGCRGIGYEIDPRLAAEARRLAKKRKVEQLVQIEEKDIFTVDYRQNTVVVMYLLPEMITKLVPKFRQLKDGSRIVAHDYPISGVEADREVVLTSNEDNVEHTLYLYTLPLK